MLLWEKAKDFLQKAFSVILIATVVVWFLQNFSFSLDRAEHSEESILAAIASVLEPVFKPLGLGDWRIITALITGFIAKESVVSSLEVLLNGNVGAVLTTCGAASMLVFSLLYTPCVAAIAAVKRELGKKWAFTMFIFQCTVAWTAAFIIRAVCMALGVN